MTVSDPGFEALKFLTRMQWMVNFEAIATVGNDEDAIHLSAQPRLFAQ